MSSGFYFNQLQRRKKNCKKIFETKYFIILLLRFHKLLIFLDSFQFQESGYAASFYHVNIDVSVEYTHLTSDNQHHTKTTVNFFYFFYLFMLIIRNNQDLSKFPIKHYFTLFCFNAKPKKNNLRCASSFILHLVIIIMKKIDALHSSSRHACNILSYHSDIS